MFQEIDIKSRRSRFSDYLWAKSVIGSRALSMSGKKYLVPLADMFNYHPHPSEREANNGANFLKYVSFVVCLFVCLLFVVCCFLKKKNLFFVVFCVVSFRLSTIFKNIIYILYYVSLKSYIYIYDNFVFIGLLFLASNP